MLTFALSLMKSDEVNLRFLRSLLTKFVIRNSGTRCRSSRGHEQFEMKQITIYHEYGLKIEANSAQVRHKLW